MFRSEIHLDRWSFWVSVTSEISITRGIDPVANRGLDDGASYKGKVWRDENTHGFAKKKKG